jgi:hypothetical protein
MPGFTVFLNHSYKTHFIRNVIFINMIINDKIGIESIDFGLKNICFPILFNRKSISNVSK